MCTYLQVWRLSLVDDELCDGGKLEVEREGIPGIKRTSILNCITNKKAFLYSMIHKMFNPYNFKERSPQQFDYDSPPNGVIKNTFGRKIFYSYGCAKEKRLHWSVALPDGLQAPLDLAIDWAKHVGPHLVEETGDEDVEPVWQLQLVHRHKVNEGL